MNIISYVIILPAYNAEDFLERSVRSVTDQSYQDYHLIIVNDGSTDKTREVAEKLAQENNRIHVLHQKNSGQIVSRSNGIRYAKEHELDKNAYYLFLDADDAFTSHAFEKINRILNESSIDMLIYGIDLLDGNSGKKLKTIGSNLDKMVTSQSELFKIGLYQYRYNSLCCKAISSNIVDYIDYSRFSNLRHAEDLIQSLDYYHAAGSVLFVKDSFYLYYTNPDSVTHKITLNNYPIDSDVRAYTWEYMQDQKIWNQKEMNDYAAFLLHLLEKKIISASLLKGSVREKSALFERIKKDPFYAELLAMDLPHGKIILLFESGKYAAVVRTAKLRRIAQALKRG